MHLCMVTPGADDQGVSPIDRVWPIVGPMLDGAVERSHGMTSLPEEYAALKGAQKQLWIAVTNGKEIIAAATTSLQSFPSGVVQANILLLGGEDPGVNELIGLLPELEKWAKAEGCNRVRVYGRKGWARRMPEYKFAAYVMQKEI